MQFVAIIDIVIDIASMNDEGAGEANVGGTIVVAFPVIAVFVGTAVDLTDATTAAATATAAAAAIIVCAAFAGRSAEGGERRSVCIAAAVRRARMMDRIHRRPLHHRCIAVNAVPRHMSSVLGKSRPGPDGQVQREIVEIVGRREGGVGIPTWAVVIGLAAGVGVGRG